MRCSCCHRPGACPVADAYVPRVGLRVSSKVCDECLFTKNKIVDDERKREVLQECRTKGTYFICHKFTLAGEPAVCRGFFNTEKNMPCQVAERLGIVVYVDPPDINLREETMDRDEPLRPPTGMEEGTPTRDLVPGNVVMHGNEPCVVTCGYTDDFGFKTRLGLRPLNPRRHSYVAYAKPDYEVATYVINPRPKRGAKEA